MRAIAHRRCQLHPLPAVSHQQVVERAEAYFRQKVGVPVRLATVSRLVGLSERGLRNAFYDVRGMSPKRCMLRERLVNARRALRDPRVQDATVTDVATGCGFYELGRFAGVYKQTFGEAPSQTLRRARRRPPARRLGRNAGGGEGR